MQVTFSGLLFLLFLGLKLTGYITWSWLWVTSPLWIPLALAAIMVICFSLFVLYKVIKLGGNLNAEKA